MFEPSRTAPNPLNSTKFSFAFLYFQGFDPLSKTLTTPKLHRAMCCSATKPWILLRKISDTSILSWQKREILQSVLTAGEEVMWKSEDHGDYFNSQTPVWSKENMAPWSRKIIIALWGGQCSLNEAYEVVSIQCSNG